MSTATRVPETTTISGDELSADDAVTTLRRYGRWNLVKNSFIRFRYADGFTNARALALQFCLSFIPLVIAVSAFRARCIRRSSGRSSSRRWPVYCRARTTATWWSRRRSAPMTKA